MEGKLMFLGGLRRSSCQFAVNRFSMGNVPLSLVLDGAEIEVGQLMRRASELGEVRLEDIICRDAMHGDMHKVGLQGAGELMSHERHEAGTAGKGLSFFPSSSTGISFLVRAGRNKHLQGGIKLFNSPQHYP